ncbi:hypothetical protein P3S67_020946 [Capsicum chacoense]
MWVGGLEPTRVSKIIKDRRLWFCDCRIVSVINVLPTVNGGTTEPLYIQLNAPTTLAPACDFWLLWYTTVTDDGSLMFPEVIKLEGHSPEDAIMPRNVFLLQLCSGMDENVVGTRTKLVYAPIDASFDDDALLLLSVFCIISLESGKEASSPNRTLDLTSALETGQAKNKVDSDLHIVGGILRSVMTIAF